jgi:hypothetical protein
MASERLKVISIAGVSHCGSTFLGALLGQLDGFVFVGELAHAARALERGFDCGCGAPLAECPVWSAVFERAFGDRAGAARLRLPGQEERARAVAWQLLRERRLLPARHDLAETRDAFVETLLALREETGCRVVVDSSKSPAYVRLLQGDPRLDVTVVHLVRDPRATAWSWQKSRDLHLPPAAVALVWDVWNPLIELLWARRPGYVRLRYEDFVARPEQTLRQIATLAGEAPDTSPFVAPDEVLLEPTHSVAGNPNRWRSGRVKIAHDRDWLSAEGFRSARTVSALTWPGRVRYGYGGRDD